jgi:hypothetical protein
MAISREVQTLHRRGIILSPLALILLSVILTTAVVMGALIGRWTAPSTSAAQHAKIIAPVSGGAAFVPGVTDFPAIGSAGHADAFVPGVTDFPAIGSAGHAVAFVPGVTDFPTS